MKMIYQDPHLPELPPPDMAEQARLIHQAQARGREEAEAIFRDLAEPWATDVLFAHRANHAAAVADHWLETYGPRYENPDERTQRALRVAAAVALLLAKRGEP